MWTDIIELREFYGTPRGQMAAAQLRRRLARYVPQDGGVTVAYGYAPPVLPFSAQGALVLMPAAQGVVPWPSEAANQAVLCEETIWPLADQSVDRLILVHALENCANPAALLTECWRVLKGNGQLILLAANRRGLWSRAEATPFGRGRPFTATQLRRLLYAAQFVPEKWERALYTPPFKLGWLLRLAPLWEDLGRRFMKFNGGVILMAAAKQLYAPVGRVDSAPAFLGANILMPSANRTALSE